MSLAVSPAPHVRSAETIPKIMWTVFLCLLPAGVAAVFYFGWHAAVIVGTCVVSSVVIEAVIQKVLGREVTIYDGSAAVTGLLLAYVLPPNVPWYDAVLGSFVAIGIAKQAFGGLGKNLWNPALVGLVVLQLAHLPMMNPSKWPILRPEARFFGNILKPAEAIAASGPLFKDIAPATSGDKPVSVESLFGGKYGYWDLFLGNRVGGIGEICGVLLVLGGLILVLKRRARWFVPVLLIGTVALLAWALPGKGGAAARGWFGGDPLYHVLAGGLLLGAFFMATDTVTTPLARLGMGLFAVGAGVLTVVLRVYVGLPEGVYVAILLMNTATPLIDRFTKPGGLGSRRTAGS